MSSSWLSLFAFATVIVMPGPAHAAWYDTAYAYKERITVDHTKVTGGSNLTDYPLLVSFTDPNLKTVGNGGHYRVDTVRNVGHESARPVGVAWHCLCSSSTTLSPGNGGRPQSSA